MFFRTVNLNCQGYYKNDHVVTGVPLKRFLRHYHEKTTEIYAGHIEIRTKKQTDFFNDFWKGKRNETKGVTYSAASISSIVISL